MFHISSVIGAGCIALSLLLFGGVAAAGPAKLSQWTTIESERYGFALAYPGSLFVTRDGRAADDGQVLESRDGGARLLVAAFENEGAASLAEYRAQLLAENYAGAMIDYAPVRKRWFVISGTRGSMHFYERVSFTCAGRLINSWALLYPAAERELYDRVVEAIAKSYSPGSGARGDCD